MKKELVKKLGEQTTSKDIQSYIADYNLLSKNPTANMKELQGKLDELFNGVIFDPKKARKLYYLTTVKVPTPEQIKEMEVLKKEEEKAREFSIVKNLAKEIEEVIGKDRIVKGVQTEKLNDYKQIITAKMPWNLKFMEDPMLTNTYTLNPTIPTSIIRALIAKGKAEVTGEDLVFVHFLSVCYDAYKDEYKAHEWRVTYTVLEEKRIMVDINHDEDEMGL